MNKRIINTMLVVAVSLVSSCYAMHIKNIPNNVDKRKIEKEVASLANFNCFNIGGVKKSSKMQNYQNSSNDITNNAQQQKTTIATIQSPKNANQSVVGAAAQQRDSNQTTISVRSASKNRK